MTELLGDGNEIGLKGCTEYSPIEVMVRKINRYNTIQLLNIESELKHRCIDIDKKVLESEHQ